GPRGRRGPAAIARGPPRAGRAGAALGAARLAAGDGDERRRALAAPGGGGMTVTAAPVLEVRYPYTGEVVGSVPLLGAEAVRCMLDVAGDARVGLNRFERSTVLERVAQTIEAAGDELAVQITPQSGLPLPA